MGETLAHPRPRKPPQPQQVRAHSTADAFDRRHIPPRVCILINAFDSPWDSIGHDSANSITPRLIQQIIG